MNRVAIAVTLLVLMLAFLIIRNTLRLQSEYARMLSSELSELCSGSSDKGTLKAQDGLCSRPEIMKDFLTPSAYNRSTRPLRRVKGIVIHYVANPGSSARENRDYFESLARTHETKASSHFIIGLSGEIIQCVPLDEISYASNQRNKDTISIECCHPGINGRFNDDTTRSLIRLTAWLCHVYGLQSRDVIRHYDVTGKLCPVYYVRHLDAWSRLRDSIQKELDQKKEKDF